MFELLGLPTGKTPLEQGWECDRNKKDTPLPTTTTRHCFPTTKYKRFKKGVRNVKINQDRIDALEAIGFVWDVHEATWQMNVKALVAYNAHHGDCLVPGGETNSKTKFVSQVRSAYKNFQKGITSKDPVLTPQRIEQLNDLHFPLTSYMG